MASFPCGVCKLDCTSDCDCIECTSCENWIHRTCVPGMSEKLFQSWKPAQLSFLCPNCVFGGVPASGAAYDCAGALSRIYCAVESGQDYWAFQSERLLLQTYDVSLPAAQPGADREGRTCNATTAILKKRCPAVLKERRPLHRSHLHVFERPPDEPRDI